MATMFKLIMQISYLFYFFPWELSKTYKNLFFTTVFQAGGMNLCRIQTENEMSASKSS